MNTPTTLRRSKRGWPLALLGTVLLAASLGLSGCSGAVNEKAATPAAGEGGRAYRDAKAVDAGGAVEGGPRQPGNPAMSTAPKPPKPGPSYIIRTARLTVRVKHVPAALDTARAAAENAGGYVGDETTDRDESGHERSRVVLRVPQAQYDSVLDDLGDLAKGGGRLVERKVDAKDVTDQVVDVESRIRSQEASVARVRELMDKATKLSDVVMLEGELSNRQAELEALKARQQSLKERTSMSTITLVLVETEPRHERDDDTPGFLDALAGGWDAFVTVLRWLAVAIGAALPFAVALALPALVWRAVRGRLLERPRGVGTATATEPAEAPEHG